MHPRPAGFLLPRCLQTSSPYHTQMRRLMMLGKLFVKCPAQRSQQLHCQTPTLTKQSSALNFVRKLVLGVLYMHCPAQPPCTAAACCAQQMPHIKRCAAASCVQAQEQSRNLLHAYSHLTENACTFNDWH